jgi:hypothetical protein
MTTIDQMSSHVTSEIADYGQIGLGEAAKLPRRTRRAVARNATAVLLSRLSAYLARPGFDSPHDGGLIRTFVLAPEVVEDPVLKGKLDAVFRDAVATAVGGGRRTQFYLIAVPEGRPHSRETR